MTLSERIEIFGKWLAGLSLVAFGILIILDQADVWRNDSTDWDTWVPFAFLGGLFIGTIAIAHVDIREWWDKNY